MSNTIASAYVQIVPSTEGIQGQLNGILDGEASKAGASAGSKLSGALGGAVKGGISAVAALGSAAVGAGAALTSAAAGVASYGDEIDKNSQKMGVSASFYQEWDAVLQHSGTSMNSMSGTFKKLSTAVQNGSENQIAAFEQLGLSMTDLQGMSTEEVFTSVISGLQGMEEGTERTALATELLGRGAMELGPLMNTSAEDTQAMIDAVNELGGVMSDDAVKDAAAFQDQLQDMQTAFSGIKNSIMSELLPAFTDIMGGLTGLATGSEGAEEQLGAGIQALIQNITSALPMVVTAFQSLIQSIMTVAPEIIQTLATGIIDSLPALVPTLNDVVIQLSTMLIQLLPQLLQAGLEVIVQLALGIAQALPELVPVIVDVVIQLVDTLVSNVDMLIDAALALILGLADGLMRALPQLMAKAPEIIAKLVTALIQALPQVLKAGLELIVMLIKGIVSAYSQLIASGAEVVEKIKTAITSKIKEFLNVGRDIIEGLKKGIADSWDSIMSWFSDKVTGLVDAAKNALKIGSPSRVFADSVGKWIPAGVAQGIEDNLGLIDSAMEDVTDATLIDSNSIYDATNGNMRSSLSGNVSTANNSVYGLLATYLPIIAQGGDVTIRLEGDASMLFKSMRDQNAKFKQQVGYSAFA